MAHLHGLRLRKDYGSSDECNSVRRNPFLTIIRVDDWIMVLPPELEYAYHREIMEFEEKEKMQYVTTAERIGIQKGERIGVRKGKKETAENLLAMGLLNSGQIAQATGLTLEEIQKLKKTVRWGNA